MKAVEAYEKVWRDYLSNKCNLAERQAMAHLQSLAALDAAQRTADTHVTVRAACAASAPQWHQRRRRTFAIAQEADFAYIAGATRGNDAQLLERALAAYGRHLALVPFNTNARRMMAETYMRLRRYQEVRLHVHRNAPPSSEEHFDGCVLDLGVRCLRRAAKHVVRFQRRGDRRARGQCAPRTPRHARTRTQTTRTHRTRTCHPLPVSQRSLPHDALPFGGFGFGHEGCPFPTSARCGPTRAATPIGRA